ncbi:hypothetical protein M426DRAFT_319582 [Hypoxylon sp. CI-4A]|nr:hypothetical protein M426DRAFT_319582 [Hypoxylon sp. CI-4A]
MNFTVEVPGEAAPLNTYELCRVLQTAASSHDHNQRQSATQQLTTWEVHPDYYYTLQSIFLEKSLPTDTRFLAIITLKNGIEKYWRKVQVRGAISDGAKEKIRARLFQGTVGESDRRLALHNSIVIAKVVRIDSPAVWPTPLTELGKLLRTTKDGDQFELSGALMILLRVVKELGTARLRKSQTMLQSSTPELVYILCEIYGAKTTEWIAFLNNDVNDIKENGDAALLAMGNSLSAIKILRRLLIIGYEHPQKDQTVQQVWTSVQAQLAEFLGFIQSDSKKIACYNDIIGKHLMQFTKLHIEMADQHPASFASLPNSLDLVRGYWDLTAGFAGVYNNSGGIRHSSSESGGSKARTEGPIPERLALKGLLILRLCIRMVHRPKQSIRYRSKAIVDEHKDAIKQIETELFKDELIIQIVNTLITHLFIFRKADLDAWEEDPQEWEEQEETQGNAYEWEVRPCAEKLFLDLLTYYKQLLIQPLLSYFTTIQNEQADIVAKEAVYTAMGLSAPLVSEEFDFTSVLKTTVVADAQRTGPLCQVLRRRIAILLSQWVPVKVTDETRPLIYEIYRHFLNPNDQCNDIVVRLTTARQLKIVCDEYSFRGELFLPYASDMLTSLINILPEVEVDETKLAILESLRSLIQRMETHITSFGDMVMEEVPEIWESTGSLGYMMKQSVLAIIQTLVMSMKTGAQRYQPMVLPLVKEAMQEDTEMYIYLVEEAMELWANILYQSQPPLSSDLIDLAETAIRLLAQQNEHAFSLTSIVGSYIMLAPERMLEDRFRAPILTAFLSSLDNKSRELLNITIRYTDSFIQLSNQLGGTPGLQVVVKDMMQVGLIPKMLEAIHEAYEAHQTTGPKARQPATDNLALTDYLAIISRIAVIDPSTFVEMLASLGPLDQIWAWLSAEWFQSTPNLGDINRLKLHLLALTRLMELPQMQELVLLKLQDYFSMWTTVMLQIVGDEAPDKGVDLLVFKNEPEGTEWDTVKDVKDRALYAADPVGRVDSLQFVKQTLNGLVQRVGGEQAFQANYAVNVDKEEMAGFQALVALSSGET